MKIKLSALLMFIAIIIGSGLYISRSPSEVLLAIPDHYRGELTIKQDVKNGKQYDVKALENHGDYIYEFTEIKNATNRTGSSLTFDMFVYRTEKLNVICKT